MATRAVRFNENEEQAIKEFLIKNPFFDFSTLARVAIINFIEKPEMRLKPSKLELEEEVQKRVIQ